MGRPVVGISTYAETARWGPWAQPAALLPWTYVDAVEAAGGVPVLLPPGAPAPADLLPRLDALILSGGPDIDPAAYEALSEGHIARLQPGRDATELALLHAALDRQLPLLGVCRGMQLLNVGLGGDLLQHLPDKVGHDGHRPRLGTFGLHDVDLEPGSRVGRALGSRVTVATHHHQGIRVLGDGLTAVGWTDDGVVEAIELDGAPFVVGVLWHPEERADGRLFAALVAAVTPG